MTSTLYKHLTQLQANPKILGQSLRGIEKEGLRVDQQGLLSTKPHPTVLGSALTHPSITTDYSEALLELITGTHHSVDALMGELDQVHRVVATNLPDELLWNHSMPAQLPAEADIPIACEMVGAFQSMVTRRVDVFDLDVRQTPKMTWIGCVPAPDKVLVNSDVAAERENRLAQTGQRLGSERPLPRRNIGQAPILRLHQIKRQDRTRLRGQRKGGVVGDAQVALEPDENIHGTFI